MSIKTQFLVGGKLSLTASYAYINAEFEEYFNRDPRTRAPRSIPTTQPASAEPT